MIDMIDGIPVTGQSMQLKDMIEGNINVLYVINGYRMPWNLLVGTQGPSHTKSNS